MSAVLRENFIESGEQSELPVVVVGTGPVGIRFVEELLQRDPDISIVIYGNEPWEPYNRVRLASLLTGEANLTEIQNPLSLKDQHRVVQHHNHEIVSINRKNKVVYDKQGNVQAYTTLVLATGSNPRIPSIKGIDKSGIYTFRNLNDAQDLVARRTRSRHAVVLGGGLLGLEAARGLQKYNTDVTIIEHANHLMASQLDGEAGELLREHMLSENIRVILKDGVKQIIGDDKIKAVKLISGRIIECDTMVISAGIKPNIKLALEAGIPVGRGIKVNDQMQTRDDDIFAIGECAEHREQIYGLVAPGLEQAGVAAYKITGGKSFYTGSQAATRLKVVGVSVFSVGRTGENEDTTHFRIITWRSNGGSYYRKLLLIRNRLVGAVGYGEWDESSRIQETVRHNRYVWPWQIKRFIRDGILWPVAEATDINEWPANAVVCQCTNVNRGTLTKAIAAGHISVETLCLKTGASSVCGSCKPLLSDMLGGKAVEAEKGSRVLVWTAVATLLSVFLTMFSPSIPFSESVQVSMQWDLLWRDGLLKQISGFSLLGLGILVSLISIRKRITKFSFGNFSSWRVVHVAIGTIAIATLIAHTGFRFGSNLNFYLMLSFIGLLMVGGIASGVIGLQHVLPRGLTKVTRELSLWSHILLLWPLPALLGFHILKSYWF